jgi:hypothetical protein
VFAWQQLLLQLLLLLLLLQQCALCMYEPYNSSNGPSHMTIQCSAIHIAVFCAVLLACVLGNRLQRLQKQTEFGLNCTVLKGKLYTASTHTV